MYRYGYHMMTPAQSFPFEGLIGLIFWVLLISLIVGLIIHLFENRNSDNVEDAEEVGGALEILKMRYAKGEISKRVFLEMKKDIS